MTWLVLFFYVNLVCFDFLLRAESICDLTKQILVLLNLLLSRTLDLSVHGHLQEVLGEDAVLGKFLMIGYLRITLPLKLKKLHTELVHLFKDRFDLRLDRALCRVAI